MIALGAVFLIEYLDDTVKTPDEVNQLVGLPTLGTVIRFRSADGRNRLVTAQDGRSPVSEAYRTLRTNLQFSTVDVPLRTLLVTSSNPYEGKSTTAANLAVVMAQAGFSTIIVDTDLRRPILDKIFGVPRNVGVANALLTSELDINNYLYDTGVENLRILTCGPKLPPSPSEILGSQRMRNLIEQLKQAADVVLFDSPPVLVAADAAVLASQVDGVLVVIDAGTTRREAVREAIGQLTKVGANLLGAVLNRLSTKGSGQYYYYYYYYSEDGRGSDGRKARRRHQKGTGFTATIKRWVSRTPS
ncbi:MAG: polysaccharide biosynthesis tyrosine autokinase [Anaerolineae bacterium]|nr:polysaccharide biosynthesis tyrosine autokinase [Anaerolineae bacterium]